MPVTKIADHTTLISDATKALLKAKVLIGIPSSKANRKKVAGDEEDGKEPVNNAIIGYAMEYGLPDQNVPARPFLMPGLESVKDQIADRLVKTGEAVLSGDKQAVRSGLEAVGLIGMGAVQQKITDGPFAPLSLRTIKERAARGGKSSKKGAQKYLKLLGEGTPKEVLDTLGEQSLIRPLIDTGQLRRSITYVVRDKGSS